LPKELDFVLVADQVRDPGNLGTMLRTALAAGVDALLLPPRTVDPFSPKVVRAGMGAHFRLPIAVTSWEEIGTTLEDLRIYLAEAGKGAAYTQADFSSPLALILGSEAHGPGAGARELAHTSVHIPMPGGGESLNTAIAAAILIFEIVRQREVRRA
jgi:TrmH family RNA methyltransferase